MRPNRRLRSAAALAALLLVTVGLPVLLIALAGWPLPRQMPDWGRVGTAVQQGDIPADVVINTLAVIVWVAWAQLVWAFGWELAVNLPRTQRGEPPRAAPLVPAAIATGVARFVAVLLSIGITIATTPAPARAALPTPVVIALADTPTAAAANHVATSTGPRSVAGCWQVSERDNLWDIADRALGDGSRAPEIIELNPSLRSARDLHAGQLLRLPADATVPTERQPEPPAPAVAATAVTSPASSTPPYLPGALVTVRRGDNLWNLSAWRLRTATGTPATPKATLDYLNEVIAANSTTIEDPNLIFPGEQFALPAIGTRPPPAPALPPAPATTEAGAPEPSDAPLPPPTTVPEPQPASTSTPAPAETITSASILSPPATVTPTTTLTLSKSHSDESPATWLAGLAGATALASGLVLTYRRLRSRAAAAGAANLRARLPAGRATKTERALVAASDLPLVRWANHELADLAGRLRPADLTANPVAVEVSEIHGLELLWDAPNPAAPPPWEATDGGWAWRLLYDADLPIPSDPDPAVIPGLVTIGERDGNTVLVDFEAFGSIAITGDPTLAEDIVRSMIAELAFGEDLANSYVHLVDLDVDGLEHSPRVQRRHKTDALALLNTVAADHDQLLQRQRLTGAFQLRLAGAAIGRELTVVVARADPLGDAAKLIAAARPLRGVALLLLGDVPDARATLEVGTDGRAVLHPLGLTVHARRFPKAAAAEVANLLRDASAVDDHSETDDAAVAGIDEGDAVTTGSAPFPATHDRESAEIDLDDIDERAEPPEPALLVRVLGVPAIDACPGLGRIELNLVTYLACNGGHATESQVIDAVWNGRAIERATLWNRISKARAALGGFIPARDQGSNVLRLAPGVMTDAQLLRHAVDHAPRVSSAQAIDQLVAAMNLVRGVPFDAVGYDWAHEQQQYADACELVERAALLLVDLALDVDDITTAREAAGQGLKALRVNEPLYRARMRIEAHCGNHAGIRSAYDELAHLLDELDDGAGSYGPAPSTTALVDQLLQAAAVRSA